MEKKKSGIFGSLKQTLVDGGWITGGDSSGNSDEQTVVEKEELVSKNEIPSTKTGTHVVPRRYSFEEEKNAIEFPKKEDEIQDISFKSDTYDGAKIQKMQKVIRGIVIGDEQSPVKILLDNLEELADVIPDERKRLEKSLAIVKKMGYTKEEVLQSLHNHLKNFAEADKEFAEDCKEMEETIKALRINIDEIDSKESQLGANLKKINAELEALAVEKKSAETKIKTTSGELQTIQGSYAEAAEKEKEFFNSLTKTIGGIK